MDITYSICLSAYRIPYGITLEKNLGRDDARNYIAKLLRDNRKKGLKTITLIKGCQWEIFKPDNCEIPDVCGIYEIYQEGEEEELSEDEQLAWDQYMEKNFP